MVELVDRADIDAAGYTDPFNDLHSLFSEIGFDQFTDGSDCCFSVITVSIDMYGISAVNAGRQNTKNAFCVCFFVRFLRVI